MGKITLKKIDESNFIDCFHLQLGEGQERFVSHPIRSLAQAYVYYGQCTPFGIYVENQMAGYVMVIYDYDEEAYNLWHLMIDAAKQNRGYGKAAVQCCLDYIRKKPFGESNQIKLTCHEENEAALHLYRLVGFRPTGERDENEIEMSLLLTP